MKIFINKCPLKWPKPKIEKSQRQKREKKTLWLRFEARIPGDWLRLWNCQCWQLTNPCMFFYSHIPTAQNHNLPSISQLPCPFLELTSQFDVHEQPHNLLHLTRLQFSIHAHTYLETHANFLLQKLRIIKLVCCNGPPN